MDDVKYLIERLEKSLRQVEVQVEFSEVGRVIRVGDGVVWIEGLPKTKVTEVLEVEGDTDGRIPVLALNLEEDLIGGVILGEQHQVGEGALVHRTGEVIKTPVGEHLIGRAVNPLGVPVDSRGAVETSEFFELERPAPGVIERESVSTPLHTGVKMIDALIPIGRGQRELIIGDRQTGKTSLTLDTIIHQKNDPLSTPICIYVAIGQKLSKIRKIYEELKAHGALEYTILVVTSASDPASLVYLAPYAGCSIGEYFRDRGQDAVVIYDDLTRHAWAWRELSLLLRRPPGREAYPGDIFYLHSRLLERAAKLKDGGSLTALPITETQLGDISAYIPTNLISITDGQIFLEPELFHQGFRPAVNVGLSVSRVGSAAQTKAVKKVAAPLKLDLAQFRELQAFLQFASELDPETQKRLKHGQVLSELLKQPNWQPVDFERIAALLLVASRGLLDELALEQVKPFEQKFLERLEIEKPELLEEVRKSKELSDKVSQQILDLAQSVISEIRKSQITSTKSQTNSNT